MTWNRCCPKKRQTNTSVVPIEKGERTVESNSRGRHFPKEEQQRIFSAALEPPQILKSRTSGSASSPASSSSSLSSSSSSSSSCRCRFSSPSSSESTCHERSHRIIQNSAQERASSTQYKHGTSSSKRTQSQVDSAWRLPRTAVLSERRCTVGYGDNLVGHDVGKLVPRNGLGNYSSDPWTRTSPNDVYG